MKRSAFTHLGLVASLTMLASPASARGLHTLPDGLAYEDLVVGKGPMPKSGSSVTVTYVGSLSNGTVFDRSADHGGTFTFPLGQGQVIKGWDEGVATMRVGGKRKLVVPPQLGYGSRGIGPIPPNSTLTFVIELLSIG